MIASRGRARDLADGLRAVLLAGELVAHELLGLKDVRGDEVRPARAAWRSGSPSVVDNRRDVRALEVADEDA